MRLEIEIPISATQHPNIQDFQRHGIAFHKGGYLCKTSYSKLKSFPGRNNNCTFLVEIHQFLFTKQWALVLPFILLARKMLSMT